MAALRIAFAGATRSLVSSVQLRPLTNASRAGSARCNGIVLKRLLGLSRPGLLNTPSPLASSSLSLPSSLSRSSTFRGISGRRRIIRQPPRRNNKTHSGSRGQTTVPTIISVLVGSGVVVWGLNQDEAPFTKRKRFIVVNRDGDFMKRMGHQTLQSVKAQYEGKILPKTHPAVRTVERVGARIAGVSGLEGCKWEFVVVQDKTLNAFALPGGKVVVFTGLFEVTPNEDSLASVLGHEVGHVVANHGGEKVSKSFLKQAVLWGLYSITGVDAFGLGNVVGAFFFELPNSREMEREADFIGLQLMAKACFDPHEMPKTFARMRDANKQKARTPAYASTHPTDDERIAKQTEWMDSAEQEYEKSGCSTEAQLFQDVLQQTRRPI